MRTCAILILATLQASAQSETNTYTFDANGHRALESTQSSGVQSIRSINGRIAPLEKVEEKVLSDDANGKVIERIIRPYDPTGNPGPAQKIRITERKNADGSLATETQIFNANINGSFALTEKSEALTKTSGNQTTTEVQIARPTLNGGLSTVERKNTTITKNGENENADTLVYRRDNNGSFYNAVREVRQTEKRDGRTIENTATYLSGQLTAQTIAETTKRADGSETKQVNIYGLTATGRPNGSQPVLREQQVIETAKTATGTSETLSIRRPAVDNPNSLGPAQKISERVCTGKCQ